MQSTNRIMKAGGTLLLAGIFVTGTAFAQQGIQVTNAWARATVAGQKVGGVYMDIRSAGSARLVSAASPAAAKVEIHNMKMDNGVMKMFPVDGIDLPAGQTVKLAPGGYHVMLVDLKQGLKKGDTAQLTLTIEDAKKSRQTVTVNAEVRDVSGGSMAH